MNKALKVSKSINISGSRDAVWNVLTTPEKIKMFLYDTETITSWAVGSSIIFKGNYEGHVYKDKGVILEHIPKEILSYSYWSGFSGLMDSPENYAKVTYILESISVTQTKLTWCQEGYANESSQQHSEQNLPHLLESIKTIAENTEV